MDVKCQHCTEVGTIADPESDHDEVLVTEPADENGNATTLKGFSVLCDHCGGTTFVVTEEVVEGPPPPPPPPEETDLQKAATAAALGGEIEVEAEGSYEEAPEE